MSEGNKKVLSRHVMEKVSDEGNLKVAAVLGLVLLLALALMATLLVMVLPGTADAKKIAPAAPVASAFGQGVSSYGEPFKFWVKATPSATNRNAATGAFIVHKGKDFVRGKLTCFRYTQAPDGSRRDANFSGPITQSTLPNHHFGAFWVTDSGRPNGVGDKFNAVNAPRAKCTTTGGSKPLKRGNVVVTIRR